MKCKNCHNLHILTDLKDEVIGKWCPNINDCPDIEIERECEYYNAMTNADKIRNMTDEELAEFWANETICEHCIHDNNQRCDFDTVCTRSYAEAMAFKWLQKEVE